jgi:hypothetical protein
MITKKINDRADLQEIINKFDIKSEVVLIKPNWVGAFPGGYTDSKIIDLILSSLKGKKVIFIESYSFWRTDKKRENGEDYFSSKEATLETGKIHWEFFKKMDEWFLDKTGITEVLQKHNAKYISITNEIWKGNVMDPKVISSLVEERFSPVSDKDLYKIVPKFLYNLKGAPLISLAKAKADSVYGLSASIKNIFGLVPDPNRYEKYHGGDPEKLLAGSIIDTHKIYQSLFDVKFLVESVYEYSYMDWSVEKSNRKEGNGRVIAGESGYEVDIEAEKIYESKMKGALENLLKEYKKIF